MEFVQDENGVACEFDYEINLISDLNKIKRDLLAGKKEYDLMQVDQQNAKDAFSIFSNRFPGQYIDMPSVFFYKANIGLEISRISLQVNALSDIYANVFGLASIIIKELKEIVGELDPNKKWENVNIDAKEELLTFAKNGLIACTNILGICNDQKEIMSHDFNEIKDCFNNQKLEEIIDVWKKYRAERTKNLIQIKSEIYKMSGRKAFRQSNGSKWATFQKEFIKYLNGWYVYFNEWKMRTYDGVTQLELNQVRKII